MTKFETGRRYFMISPCDHDCAWIYKVIARTAQTVTLVDEAGNTIRCRISRNDATTEMVRPLGKYSMCPVLRASRVC